MSHISLGPCDLECMCPPIPAREDDELDDLADDKGDTVYQKGLAIAGDIRQEMRAHGRRKLAGTKQREDEPAAAIADKRTSVK